jgi:hypothetical protein
LRKTLAIIAHLERKILGMVVEEILAIIAPIKRKIPVIIAAKIDL